MVAVPLAFLPPSDPDIVTLLIFEGTSLTGSFTQIDSTSNIGAYPNYINRYVTQNAISPDDFFAIQWVDSEGATSEMSAPIQGGTVTLVGDIVQRVLARDSSLNELVVVSEAEDVISFCYNVTDPYSIDYTTVNRLWLNSLAILTLCGVLYVQAVINSAIGSSYSAGIINQSVGSPGDQLQGIERLQRKTLARMGIGGSRVASFWHRPRGSFPSTTEVVNVTASRLLATTAIITKEMQVRDIPSGFLISVD
jgi:hypothetical protein